MELCQVIIADIIVIAYYSTLFLLKRTGIVKEMQSSGKFLQMLLFFALVHSRNDQVGQSSEQLDLVEECPYLGVLQG